jgi:hypothetical protein
MPSQRTSCSSSGARTYECCSAFCAFGGRTERLVASSGPASYVAEVEDKNARTPARRSALRGRRGEKDGPPLGENVRLRLLGELLRSARELVGKADEARGYEGERERPYRDERIPAVPVPEGEHHPNLVGRADGLNLPANCSREEHSRARIERGRPEQPCPGVESSSTPP